MNRNTNYSENEGNKINGDLFLKQDNLFSYLFFESMNFIWFKGNYLRSIIKNQLKSLLNNHSEKEVLLNFLDAMIRFIDVSQNYKKNKIKLDIKNNVEINFKINNFIEETKFINFYLNVTSLFFNMKDKKVELYENPYIKQELEEYLIYISTSHNETDIVSIINNEIRHKINSGEKEKEVYENYVKKLINDFELILKQKEKILVKNNIEEESLLKYIFIVDWRDYKRKIKSYSNDGKINWEKTKKRRDNHSLNYLKNDKSLISKEERIKFLKSKIDLDDRYDIYKYFYIDTMLLLLKRYYKNYKNSLVSLENNLSSSNMLIFNKKYIDEIVIPEKIARFSVHKERINNDKMLKNIIDDKTFSIIKNQLRNNETLKGKNKNIYWNSRREEINQETLIPKIKFGLNIFNGKEVKNNNNSTLIYLTNKIKNEVKKRSKINYQTQKVIFQELNLPFGKEKSRLNAKTLLELSNKSNNNLVKVKKINKEGIFPIKLVFEENTKNNIEYFLYRKMIELWKINLSKDDKSFISGLDKKIEWLSNAERLDGCELCLIYKEEIKDKAFDKISKYISIEELKDFFLKNENIENSRKKTFLTLFKKELKSKIENKNNEKIIDEVFLFNEVELIEFILSSSKIDNNLLYSDKLKYKGIIYEFKRFINEEIKKTNNFKNNNYKIDSNYDFVNNNYININVVKRDIFTVNNGKRKNWNQVSNDYKEMIISKIIQKIDENKNNFNLKFISKVKFPDFYYQEFELSVVRDISKFGKLRNILEVKIDDFKKEIQKECLIKVKYSYLVSNKAKNKNLLYEFINFTKNIDSYKIEENIKKEFEKIINYIIPLVLLKIYKMKYFLNENHSSEYKKIFDNIWKEIEKLNYFKGINIESIGDNSSEKKPFFVIKKSEKSNIEIWIDLIKTLKKMDFELV